MNQTHQQQKKKRERKGCCIGKVEAYTITAEVMQIVKIMPRKRFFKQLKLNNTINVLTHVPLTYPPLPGVSGEELEIPPSSGHIQKHFQATQSREQPLGKTENPIRRSQHN